MFHDSIGFLHLQVVVQMVHKFPRSLHDNVLHLWRQRNCMGVVWTHPWLSTYCTIFSRILCMPMYLKFFT
jgi:hypothetical protein